MDGDVSDAMWCGVVGMCAEGGGDDGCEHVPTAAFGCCGFRDGGGPVADEPVAIPRLEGRRSEMGWECDGEEERSAV